MNKNAEDDLAARMPEAGRRLRPVQNRSRPITPFEMYDHSDTIYDKVLFANHHGLRSQLEPNGVSMCLP